MVKKHTGASSTDSRSAAHPAGTFDGERHGYGIMKQVDADSQGKVKMGPGTLYGSMGRMMEAGLIRESDKRVDPEMDDERRIYYKLAGAGAGGAGSGVRAVSRRSGGGGRTVGVWPVTSRSGAIERGMRCYCGCIHGPSVSGSAGDGAVLSRPVPGTPKRQSWIVRVRIVGLYGDVGGSHCWRTQLSRSQLSRTMLRAALVALGLLMVPLVAPSRMTPGWNWPPRAFVLVYVLFFGTALAYGLIARKMGAWTY